VKIALISNNQRNSDSPKPLYFSRDFTFKQLKGLLLRIFKSFNFFKTSDIRLWKLDHFSHLNDILSDQRKFSYDLKNHHQNQTNFPGICLEKYNEIIIADSGITDSDIICVEYKIEGRWIFYYDPENVSSDSIKIPAYEEYSYIKYWENVYNMKSSTWEEKLLPEEERILKKIQSDEIAKIESTQKASNLETEGVEKCFTCLKENPKKFKICNQCKKAFFCSRKCYTQGQRNHNNVCISKRVGSPNNLEGHIEDPSKKTKQPQKILLACGLVNSGFLCFINSSLQCLFYTPSFRNLILNQMNDPKRGNTDQVIDELARLFSTMSDLATNITSASEFRNIISTKNKQFNGQSQNDAQEFLSYILDLLCENQSPIKNEVMKIFSGEYNNVIEFSECHSSSTQNELFYSLNLPIEDGFGEIEVIITTSTSHIIIYNISYEDDFIELNEVVPKIKQISLLQHMHFYCFISEKKLKQIDANEKLLNIFKMANGMPIYAIETKENINNFHLNLAIIGKEKEYSFLFGSDKNFDFHSMLKHSKDEVKCIISKYTNQEPLKLEISSHHPGNNLDLFHFRLDRSLDIKELWAQFCRKKLDLKTNSISKFDSNSLYGCLEKFTSSERLIGSNQIFCTKCQKKEDSLKSIFIKVLPEVFILQLKRFKIQGNFKRVKNTKLIKFDYELHLSSQDQSEVAYDLYAILNHMGNMEKGHYTAFCSNGSIWLELDDSRVKEVDKNNVVTEFAYVLFYKRKEKGNNQ